MPTLLVFHEVDDVEHWLASTKRDEVWAPAGITGRIFRDLGGANRVGVIVDVPDMDTFQKFIESDAAAEAMEYDGVRAETVSVLVEGPAGNA
jgi:hypothetical protein